MRRTPARWITKPSAIMIASWLMLLPTYALPGIRLDEAFSVWLCRLTGTAGVTGAGLIGLALVGLLVIRAALSWKHLLQETLVHILVLALVLGGGALANEYLIKNSLAIPRPNIVWLAEEDALGMAAEQFYASMSKRERQAHLQQVLTDPSFDVVRLTPHVREHWIHETGFSLPSGHAFTAMLLATYFLWMGSALVWQRWLLYLLPGWALLVAWSRVLLGVHRPEDVLWGGLLGIMLGAVAVMVSRRLLRRWRRVEERL